MVDHVGSGNHHVFFRRTASSPTPQYVGDIRTGFSSGWAFGTGILSHAKQHLIIYPVDGKILCVYCVELQVDCSHCFIHEASGHFRHIHLGIISSQYTVSRGSMSRDHATPRDKSGYGVAYRRYLGTFTSW